jgi:hypothetical protein
MMISLLQAKYLEDGKFSLCFSNGAEGVFDLKGYLATRNGPLLLPLQDESYVRRAFVEAGALAWPNGLEIAPERVYESTRMAKLAA